MNKSRLLGAVCVCLTVASFKASAVLIDNGTFTTDNVSGLDWLDLSITAGQSYNDALTSNPGWRYATNAEVENIFGISFNGFYDTTGGSAYGYSQGPAGAYSGQTTDIQSFQSTFGLINLGGDEYSFGLYEDEDNILRMMGAYQNGAGNNIVYGPEFVENYDSSLYQYRTSSNGAYGSYLVRTSVVPIPAAIWLFGSGLLGLVGIARRKKAA